MRSVIVGLGVQGRKRQLVLEDSLVATIDKYNSEADVDDLGKIDEESFEAIFSCVPDETKIENVYDALRLKKHILVEKPLILDELSDFKILEANSHEQNIFIQSAYNHRFEPNFVRVKNLLEGNTLGEIYSFKCFYGNGTAGLISNSEWRNTSYGVGVDLGSHVLDLLHYFFGTQTFEFSSQTWNHETACPDRAILFGHYGSISITIETTYLSWRNTFWMEIIGKEGSISVHGLCKWSQSTLERRIRKLPSGVPIFERFIEPEGDPTWRLEVSEFFGSILNGNQTDLSRDMLIQEILEKSRLLDKVSKK